MVKQREHLKNILAVTLLVIIVAGIGVAVYLMFFS